MEALITNLDTYYTSKLNIEQNKKPDDNITVVPLNALINKNQLDDNSQLAINFSTLSIDKIINLLNTNQTLRTSFFSNLIYQTLSEDKILQLIKSVSMPSPYHDKFLIYSTKSLKNKEEAYGSFIEKNIKYITEETGIKIIKNANTFSNRKTIYKYFIENTVIDIDYMMQLIKENEMNNINKTELSGLIKTLIKLDKYKDDEIDWVILVKNLNLILYLKKEYTDDEYKQNKENGTEIEQKINNKINEKENETPTKIKNYDIDLINKIQNRNNVLTEVINF